MQLEEIQQSIELRRNRIFLLMEEVRRLRIQQRVKVTQLHHFIAKIVNIPTWNYCSHLTTYWLCASKPPSLDLPARNVSELWLAWITQCLPFHCCCHQAACIFVLTAALPSDNASASLTHLTASIRMLTAMIHWRQPYKSSY